MRKPPFNAPAFSRVFAQTFGKVFGVEALFAPEDIPNLLAWYDAADPSTITDTNGNVDAWTDKSGNGNDFAQSGAPRPTTGTQTINGLNTIAFNGTNEFLSIATFTPTPNFTIAMVFRVDGINDELESIISFNDNLAGNEDFQIEANSDVAYHGDFTSTNLGDITGVRFPTDLDTVEIALIYQLATVDKSVRLFQSSGPVNSDVGDYNGNLSADQNFKMGVNRGGVQFLNVDIGEMLFINRAIGVQERTQLFDYFNSRWGT